MTTLVVKIIKSFSYIMHSLYTQTLVVRLNENEKNIEDKCMLYHRIFHSKL